MERRMADKAKTRENLQKLADFVGTNTRSLRLIHSVRRRCVTCADPSVD